MLKIGEFSKLSMITVKALRFYEKEGLLLPSYKDELSGYRYYTTSQLKEASLIKMLRQLDFSIEEIKKYLNSNDLSDALNLKENDIRERIAAYISMLSVIEYLKGGENMKYQAVIKYIPEMIVYSEERTLKTYDELTNLVLESALECQRLNPDIECVKPDYCFSEYLDNQYKEKDIRTRYSQAVTKAGKENERIKFRKLEPVKVISIYHKGSYKLLGEAYAYILDYAKNNGFEACGNTREMYIDRPWNKENEDDYLTEIELPVK